MSKNVLGYKKDLELDIALQKKFLTFLEKKMKKIYIKNNDGNEYIITQC